MFLGWQARARRDQDLGCVNTHSNSSSSNTNTNTNITVSPRRHHPAPPCRGEILGELAVAVAVFARARREAGMARRLPLAGLRSTSKRITCDGSKGGKSRP